MVKEANINLDEKGDHFSPFYELSRHF